MGRPRGVQRRRARLVRDAGHAHPLPPHRPRPRGHRARGGRDRRAGHGRRRPDRRPAVHHAARRLAALSGQRADGETDDGRSVCGPDSELWDAPGVFVAGNGVIPTSTACNPTLTSVALAVKGARRIARELAG
ncbi:GMC oxidoreductase [Streptomyces sp. L7]|uniref:GMC oxidoreductase n=1 Tax=Streptomyces sp. L7 TaxID=3423954 RepID=UPI003D99389B